MCCVTSRRVCMLALMAACAGVAWSDSGPAALAPDDVLRCMERHGVVHDVAALRRAAAEAMLKAVDARAELMDEAGARRWATNRSICCATQWPGAVAYVKLAGLYPGDAAEVGEALRRYTAQDGTGGAILDLRGGAGNATSGIAAVAGTVMDAGDPVLAIRAGGVATVAVVRALAPAAPRRCALVLLTDGGTAGASEALAAGLKGRPGVMVLGAATAGDGAARERVAIADGYTAYLATGRFVLPGGAGVPAHGVQPDIAIAAGEPNNGTRKRPDALSAARATSAGIRSLMHQVNDDPVLRRAVDLLLGLQAMARFKGVAGAGDTGVTNAPAVMEGGRAEP